MQKKNFWCFLAAQIKTMTYFADGVSGGNEFVVVFVDEGLHVGM